MQKKKKRDWTKIANLTIPIGSNMPNNFDFSEEEEKKKTIRKCIRSYGIDDFLFYSWEMIKLFFIRRENNECFFIL